MISRKITAINNAMLDLVEMREKVRAECPHDNIKYTAGSNTGNYDPSCDSYWYDLECTDCLQRERVDSELWNSFHIESYPIKGKVWGRESITKVT